jgi:hypothetical protein
MSATASFATPCVMRGLNPSEWISSRLGSQKVKANYPVTGVIRIGEQKRPDQAGLYGGFYSIRK